MLQNRLRVLGMGSSSLVSSSSIVSFFRVSLGCVDSAAIDTQLELATKAAKLRTKMMKRIRKINIGKEH